jgi:hypothetical protein
MALHDVRKFGFLRLRAMLKQLLDDLDAYTVNRRHSFEASNNVSHSSRRRAD